MKTKYPWKTTPVGGSFFVPNAITGVSMNSSNAVLDAYDAGFIKLGSANYLGNKIVPKSRWISNTEFSKKGKVLGVTVERAA